MSQPPDAPEIVTYRIPRIEVYHVTEDELSRIEEGYGQVSQDLTFAIAAGSLCVSFLIVIATGSIVDRLFLMFLVLVVLSAVVAIYTGVKWWRARKVVPAVIAAIRSRKAQPQVPQRDTT